jgi:hypothetical protein
MEVSQFIQKATAGAGADDGGPISCVSFIYVEVSKVTVVSCVFG